MTQVLVDSNALLDALTEDPVWFEWSSAALAELAAQTDGVLLTRDAGRYRTYFPQLRIHAPDTG